MLIVDLRVGSRRANGTNCQRVTYLPGRYISVGQGHKSFLKCTYLNCLFSFLNVLLPDPRGVKGFHDSTKGTYLLREFPLANKVPSRDFLTNCP